jgi:hypothetical protein
MPTEEELAARWYAQYGQLDRRASTDISIYELTPKHKNRNYVCCVRGEGIMSGLVERRDANVRLIRRAPEMRALLHRFVSLAPSKEGLGGHAPVAAFVMLAHEARELLRTIEHASMNEETTE